MFGATTHMVTEVCDSISRMMTKVYDATSRMMMEVSGGDSLR